MKTPESLINSAKKEILRKEIMRKQVLTLDNIAEEIADDCDSMKRDKNALPANPEDKLIDENVNNKDRMVEECLPDIVVNEMDDIFEGNLGNKNCLNMGIDDEIRSEDLDPAPETFRKPSRDDNGIFETKIRK